MKKIYFIGICVLLCAIHTQAMPVQAPTPTTQITPVKKPTFMERMADKILKKKLKKAKKKANMTQVDAQAIVSPILGIVSLLAWVSSIYASFGLSTAGVVISIIVGFAAGIAAVVLGARALKRIDNDPNVTGRALAITGIVLGSLALLIFVTQSILALANL